jgi:hypothetical protein
MAFQGTGMKEDVDPGLSDGLRESFTWGIHPLGHPASRGQGMAAPLDDYIKRGRKIIRQYGWMVQGVLHDAQQASYSYTVGLSKGPSHPKSSW